MVAASVIEWMNLPLADDGPRLGHRVNDRRAVFHQRLRGEGRLAHRHRNVAVLVELEFHAARLDFLDRLGGVLGHGAGLGVRHQTARPEHFAELADFRHRCRGCHGHVEILETLPGIFSPCPRTRRTPRPRHGQRSPPHPWRTPARGPACRCRSGAGRCRAPSGRTASGSTPRVERQRHRLVELGGRKLS